MQKLEQRYEIRQDDFLFTYKFVSVGKILN
jgi:hypothetical protein